MILINLLPPELRRARRSGVNPVILAAAGGAVICIGLVGVYGWLQYGRLKAAEEALAAADADLAAAQAQAEAVKKVEADIAEAEKLHGTVTNLFMGRVTWAKTIDDFANMLAQTNENKWNLDGYQVRCTTLSVMPAQGVVVRGAKAPAGIMCSFRANFRILGENRDRPGSYIKSFFESVEASPFWTQNGFIGKAEEQYNGDTPQWKADIARVSNDFSFEWRRVKPIGAKEGAK